MIREMALVRRVPAEGPRRPQRQTQPGNKKGGCPTSSRRRWHIGQVRQRGDFGLVGAGEKVRQKGLIYAATPASDFICGTLQLAAAEPNASTTGRGTPYGWRRCR